MSGNKWRDTFIRQALDPASFRAQRDQAHESIRELLALNDSLRAELRDVMETIVWLNSDECNDAREWPAFVRRAQAWLEANP